MVANKVLRAAAAVVASAGLMVSLTGIAGAATGSGSISTTGPDSTNKVISKEHTHISVTNNNTLGLSNTANQNAVTGTARVNHNTTGGSATTNGATNSSTLGVTVDVTNTMPAMPASGGGTGNASINTTGPDSLNLVVSKNSTSLNVQNNNMVSLSNTVNQNAASGNATVSGNTTGGNATSGAASNTASATFDLTVTN